MTRPNADPDTTEGGAAETDTEDDFHSPEASPRAQTSPNDSPERDPDENAPDPNSESPPETSSPPQAGPSNRTDQNPPEESPPVQAGPSNRPDQDPNADTLNPNDRGHLSRGARGRAPIKRQRSVSHSPTKIPPKTTQHYHPPGSLCAPCQQDERAIQQDERAIQLRREQEPIPAFVQRHREEAPPAGEQGAQPQTTTRSGRKTKRPSHLGYQGNFSQHETREATPTFRLPKPRPSKPRQTNDEGSGTET